MKETILIINKQHNLFPEQEEILKNNFGTWKTIHVPESGWSLEEQMEKISELKGNTVIFASPIPYMLKELAYISGYASEENCIAHNAYLVGRHTRIYVFHNDNRQKTELPNGKVIQSVAKTGWKLV